MVLILLGAPGSGKGTQANRLAQKLGLRHLSTGDMLRRHVNDGTEIGKKVESTMKSGQLVPDELIVKMIADQIESMSSGGVMLDGFPRNLSQADKLDEMFSDHGLNVDRVLFLSVEEDELIKRLSGRFYCPKCDAGYNYPMHLPKSEGVCDNDGEKLLRRPDDEESIVRDRLEVYRTQTSPLEDYYRKQGKLVEIRANVHPDKVTEAMLKAITDIGQTDRRQAKKAKA